MLSAQAGIAAIRNAPPSSNAGLKFIWFSPKCEWRGFHSHRILNGAQICFCSIVHICTDSLFVRDASHTRGGMNAPPTKRALDADLTECDGLAGSHSEWVLHGGRHHRRRSPTR